MKLEKDKMKSQRSADKPSKSSKLKDIKQKDWPCTEGHEDLYTGEKIYRTKEQILDIANEALRYCEVNPRVLKLSQFRRVKGIKESTWKYWYKYDWFREKIDECMRILGDKREVGASFKELDKEMQLKVMHLYDPEWININAYHAQLKEEQQSANAELFKEILKEVLQPFEEKKKE